MAIVLTKQSKKSVLDFIVEKSLSCYVMLFQNDLTPDDDTEFADFVEADYDGYDQIDFTASDRADIDEDDRGSRFLDDVTFTRTAGPTDNTIYGWALVYQGADDEMVQLFCERFPAPLLMVTPGDEIKFNLAILDELGT